MKLVFPSQNDKDLALQTARRTPLEACGQMYIHVLEEGLIEGQPEPKVVPDESLVDESVEQIK